MGTTYHSTCGCLTATEPDQRLDESIEDFFTRRQEEADAFEQACLAHHQFCCGEQKARTHDDGGLQPLDTCLEGKDDECPVIRRYNWRQVQEAIGLTVVMTILDESDLKLGRRHASFQVWDDEDNRQALADSLGEDPKPTMADLEYLYSVAHQVSESLHPSVPPETAECQRHLDAVRHIATALLGPDVSVEFEVPHLVSHSPFVWAEYYTARLWAPVGEDMFGNPVARTIYEARDAVGDDALAALTIAIADIHRVTPNQ